MDPELIALAGAAASIVIRSMATDLWSQTKQALSGVFGADPSGGPEIEDDLDRSSAELKEARRQGDDLAEAELTAQWTGRFRRLLAADPAAGQALRSILDELAEKVPKGPDAKVNVHLEAEARGEARIYQAGRDQHIS